MGGAFLLALTSCGTAKELPRLSGTENLQSLTQITEGTNKCIQPGGSVESNILFFVMKPGYGQANIYKKTNPIAPAQVQITSDNSSFQPTYCVETDRVAFSRIVNGYSDIYMMPVTKGNALIPVTETAGVSEENPSFSPDGSLLAYEKGNTISTSEIWVKNLTTGENMLLGKGLQPSISPDGKRIVYAKVESNNTRNIWVMDINGGNAQQLTVSKGEFSGYPKWSPSGKKIVFQSNKKKGNFDIFVMNADGSGLVQLTTNESDDLTPFWSKDGYIYMSSDRGAQSGQYNIWRFYYDE